LPGAVDDLPVSDLESDQLVYSKGRGWFKAFISHRVPRRRARAKALADAERHCRAGVDPSSAWLHWHSPKDFERRPTEQIYGYEFIGLRFDVAIVGVTTVLSGGILISSACSALWPRGKCTSCRLRRCVGMECCQPVSWAFAAGQLWTFEPRPGEAHWLTTF